MRTPEVLIVGNSEDGPCYWENGTWAVRHGGYRLPYHDAVRIVRKLRRRRPDWLFNIRISKC